MWLSFTWEYQLLRSWVLPRYQPCVWLSFTWMYQLWCSWVLTRYKPLVWLNFTLGYQSMCSWVIPLTLQANNLISTVYWNNWKTWYALDSGLLWRKARCRHCILERLKRGITKKVIRHYYSALIWKFKFLIYPPWLFHYDISTFQRNSGNHLTYKKYSRNNSGLTHIQISLRK